LNNDQISSCWPRLYQWILDVNVTEFMVCGILVVSATEVMICTHCDMLGVNAMEFRICGYDMLGVNATELVIHVFGYVGICAGCSRIY
jgi:hypothetical protein